MLKLSRATGGAPARASRTNAVSVRALWGNKPGDGGKARSQDKQYETQQAVLRERREKAAAREAAMNGNAKAKAGAAGRSGKAAARRGQAQEEEEEEDVDEEYEEAPKKGGLGGLLGGLFKRR